MSPEITITSEELRERVEEYLDRWIPDDVWNRSEPYARRKLDRRAIRRVEGCVKLQTHRSLAGPFRTSKPVAA